jgi:nucleotide-binding universal stress UspA family protein
MKILIAYDGSDCSDGAIDDLPNAGLPGTANVLIFAVAETPLGDPQVEVYLMNRRMGELRAAVQRAATRVRKMFPGWHVDTDVWPGAAPAAIVERAKEFRPDLIVVGSHGRSRLGRLVLGSVSQSVLHRTRCSVRIAHRPMQRWNESIRVLVGSDGSPDADALAHAVAARYWPVTTEVRVVGVVDGGIPLPVAASSELALVGDTAMRGAPSAYADEDVDPRETLGQSLKDACAVLRVAGVRATPQVLEGEPAQTLLDEAERWGADCIFVGERGLGPLERFFLGSVSTAVAVESKCSVEVMRTAARRFAHG